ncbi:uncharacterized protein KD926_002870 [Aspergillus affinis]|uniref:uncharacterized protein n=1 Tax=Aspergillus affinis TaxID=1070780 RepID=UPI0022FE17FB|nr:uncharacterized protein KD926_002870 [Aspergillus affinis]KAI9035806.1 hypothetical protein KD926_002870 [Aspergillus affinis]
MTPLFEVRPRPTSVNGLIKRLGDADCNSKEKEALQALVVSMVDLVRNQDLATYYLEASRLAQIADKERYFDLMRALTNAVTKYSTEGTILDRHLLPSLDYALRCRRTNPAAESFNPVSTLTSVFERLKLSFKQADIQTQYHLLFFLGTVLDTLIDLKVNGINREEIYEPLVNLLDQLKSHDEPRLAQAASYASEALRGVPDNVDVWNLFWQTSGQVISAASNIAGGVTSMDPGKFVTAAPEVLELYALLKDLLDAGHRRLEDRKKKKLEEALRNNINKNSNQRLWYRVLRYASLLLSANSFDVLQGALRDISIKLGSEFWCGLYAQVEQTWLRGDNGTKASAVDFIEWTFSLESVMKVRRHDKQVQRMVALLSETLEHPEWKTSVKERHCMFRRPFRTKITTEPTLRQPFQYRLDEQDRTSLLEDAWIRCNPAQRFYADVALTQYYKRDDWHVLKIFRLSGEPLEMKSCFINLGIVESASSERETSDERFEVSLRRRLTVYPSKNGKAIHLPDLFSPRKLANGREGRPERILIRGRAGVGKTTLSKRIVHDMLRGQLTSWGFDRVLWIPLRSLDPGIDLKQFIIGKMFGDGQPEREMLATALWEMLAEPSDTRTLFILDGFDEIADKAEQAPFAQLLARRNVIITSRPYAIHPYQFRRGFDLELETVGFQPDQVFEYLDRAVADEVRGQEIKDFIRNQSLMKGLLQIPIQLDALCYSWGETTFSDPPQTMTALYQAIELRLWRKDIVRLNRGSEIAVKALLDRDQLEASMKLEVDLLEQIAFNGLYHNTVDFAPRFRHKVYKMFPGIAAIDDTKIDRLSFLRAVDSGPGSKVYYFIHLTFQEYFAANYFVRCWVNNVSLNVIQLNMSGVKQVSPKELLMQEKYNGRYNIMWRLAVGILHSQNLQHSLEFIDLLNDFPRDILGPVHARILMHCFNEIPQDQGNLTLEERRSELEKKLENLLWLDLGTGISFASEMEFPERLLSNLLTQGSNRCQHKVLFSLFLRPHLSHNLVRQVAELEDPSNSHSVMISGVLASHHKIFFNKILDILENGSEELQGFLCDQLQFEKDLPDEFMNASVHLVSTTGSDEAATLLSRQSTLQQNIITELIYLLRHENPVISCRAVQASYGAIATDESLLTAVINLQDDEDDCTVYSVTKALAHAPACRDVQECLTKLLQDPAWKIRHRAAESLEAQHNISTDTIEALLQNVYHSNPNDQVAALKAWCKHAPSRDKILEICLSCLESPELISTAIDMIGRYWALPNDRSVFEQVYLWLGGSQSNLHELALGILKAYRNLDDGCLRQVITFLSDAHPPSVRSMALKVLAAQPKLPEGAIGLVETLLEGDSDSVAGSALEVFLEHSIAISSTTAMAIIKLASRVYNPFTPGIIAFKTRLCRKTIPVETVHTLIAFLDSESAEVRKIAGLCLSSCTGLPSMLSGFGQETWARIFCLWFERSLKGDLYCFLWDDHVYLHMPEGSGTIDVSSCEQREKLDYATRAVEGLIPLTMPVDETDESEDRFEFFEYKSSGEGESDEDRKENEDYTALGQSISLSSAQSQPPQS